MKIAFRSLYPSILIQNNISINTQIGKIDIPNKVYDGENAYHNDKYVRSGEFIDNMMTDNNIEFSHRWFGLAGVNEFLQDMKDFASNFEFGVPYNRFKVENGRLIENPLYDMTYPSEQSSEDEDSNPIIDLSTLDYNGLLTDFNKMKELGDNKNGVDDTD